MPAELLTWCALGPLRLHLTAFNGDVVSKAGAGSYGLEVAPDTFDPVLRRALALRTGEIAPDPVAATEMATCVELVRWCVDEVLRRVDVAV